MSNVTLKGNFWIKMDLIHRQYPLRILLLYWDADKSRVDIIGKKNPWGSIMAPQKKERPRKIKKKTPN